MLEIPKEMNNNNIIVILYKNLDFMSWPGSRLSTIMKVLVFGD